MKLSLGVCIGSLVIILATSMMQQHGQTHRTKSRISVFSVWMICILIWPLIWAAILKDQIDNPLALSGLIWPIAILSIDILNMNQSTYESNVQSKRSVLSMDANAIVSLTFAISSIVGAQNHTCCKRIFMFAIIGCLAFVMPSPYATSGETVVLECIQKAVLAYATGLLLMGVLLSINETSTLSEN